MVNKTGIYLFIVFNQNLKFLQHNNVYDFKFHLTKKVINHLYSKIIIANKHSNLIYIRLNLSIHKIKLISYKFMKQAK